ncbi:hypothetical protein ABT297_30075 [Dactylosporangium sp. NPDC000555]|uniref:hypothetical protein n=1 Tax=Dactylosporangium sp. NPDC000555 TaxID=3154260 RepID=UPI003332FCC9
MPKISDNEDGTQTLSINSAELRVVKRLLDEHVPEFKRVVQFFDEPQVRATIGFFKSAIS